ncbi:carboxypeptidase-like regulatory domain-containing protein [Salinibius halmophilus]|uniref:carboxypeptidase-like regulatory domain-containing protein n=1 Tax=Salinibius halmophilus TaxID=1853216 RepID=UPI000E668F4E|nr:carboxypeptidase-like regulatory domain-containing protein [Salinibius halmophilus]
MYLLKKKTLAISIAASSAIFLAACGTDTPSTEGNSETPTEVVVSPVIEVEQKVDFTDVTAPRGMVTGTVVDSNGNPLAGVRVGIAGQVVETNELGTYVFEEVRATGVDTIDAARTQYLQVTILGGAIGDSNYMGAKVNVLPRAQIFEGESVDGAGLDAQTNVTFVDGFVAEAGVAVLPELKSSISGRLIDSSNGQPLPNVKVALDVDSVSGAVSVSNGVSGVQTLYSSAALPTATADADGYFRFDNLPADTSFTLALENEVERSFDVKDLDPTSVNTDNEDIVTDLKQVMVDVTEFVDDVAPYIVRVTNVIADGESGQIVRNSNQVELVFSEPVDVRDLTTVRASAFKDGTASRVPVIASQGSDKTRLLLSFESESASNTLEEVKGREIQIYIPRGVIVDTSSLKNGLVGSNLNSSALKFTTSQSGEQDKNTAAHVRITLNNYDDLKLDNIAVVPAQMGDDGSDPMQALDVIQKQSNSFADADDVKVGIQQLNVAEAKGRLDALLKAYTDKLGFDAALVETTVARVSVDTSPAGAAYFTARVIDSVSGETKKTAEVSFVNSPLSVTENSAEGVNTFYVRTGASEVQEALVSKIEPGDILEITSYDSFGTPGEPVTLPLVDNVPPTTSLQFAYGTDPAENTTKVEFYGQGGELSSYTGSQSQIGMPILPLTPRLLVEVDGTNNGPNDDAAQLRQLRKLYNLNTVSADERLEVIGKPIIDPASGVYDRNAYRAFADNADLSATVGVAFTESVDLVNTDLVTYSNSAATVTPSDWKVANDIVATDIGGEVSEVDLLQFSVPDIYQFALEQSGDYIFDFTGAVSDLAGNVTDTDTNAKIQIQDQMPPLVKTARYFILESGTDFPTDALEVVFDKPVAKVENGKAVISETELTFALGATTITVDGSEDYIVPENELNKLILLPSSWGGDLTRQSVFTLPAYQQNGAWPFQSSVFANAHAEFAFENIPAAVSGKSWADYSEIMDAPKFALVNEISVFATQSPFTLTKGSAKELIVKVSVTHPLNDERILGAGRVITGAESTTVTGLFSVASGVTAENVTSVTVTREGLGDYTFKITLQNDVQDGVEYTVQTINNGSNVLQSGFDKTETIPTLGENGLKATF